MELFLLSVYLSRRCFGRRKVSGGLRDLDVEALSQAAKDPVVSHEELESRIRFELDATWTVFDSEARILALEYSRLENAAAKYCQGLKGRLRAREELLIDLEDGSTESVSCEDPYWRQQLKDGLITLHRRGTTLIQAKMSNHQRMALLLRLVSSSSERSALLASVMSHPFFTTKTVRSLMEEVELLYAAVFCHGSVEVARTSLHGKASLRMQDGPSYGFGLRMGVTLVLLVWLLWDTFVDDPMGKDFWHDPAFKVFRGLGNVVLLFWAAGTLVFVLYLVGIDYGRLLNLDPSLSSARDLCDFLWTRACEFSIAFLLGFLCFYKALRGVFLHSLPAPFPHTVPLLLSGFMTYWYITKCDRKLSVLRALRNTVLAPFAPVTFQDTVIADVLTSVVRVLLDLSFTSLYSVLWLRSLFLRRQDLSFDPISSTWAFNKVLAPMLTGLPLWWRFLQSLRRAWETGDRSPHYENALKYASALSVSMWGAYNSQYRKDGLWQTAFVLAILYQFYWDVFVDWALLQWDDDMRLRLRRKLLFKSRRLYYGVIALDLVLRLFWMLTLLPDSRWAVFGSEVQLRLSPILAAAEIVRRFVWLLFRLENEHLVVYRPIPPPLVSAGRRRRRQDASSSPHPVVPPPVVQVVQEQKHEDGQGGENAKWPPPPLPPPSPEDEVEEPEGDDMLREEEEEEDDVDDETVRLFEAIQSEEAEEAPGRVIDMLQVNGVARSRRDVAGGDPTVFKEAVGLTAILVTIIISAMLYQ